MSDAVRSVSLGRRAFLREIILALISATVLPILFLIAMWCIQLGAPIAPTVIFTWLAIFCVVAPVIIYSSLRMNAAALARQRHIDGQDGITIHEPLKGPWGGSRVAIAGSVTSRITAGLPCSVSFCAGIFVLGPQSLTFIWLMATIPTVISVISTAILILKSEKSLSAQ